MFQREGRGTPSPAWPALPPVRLVTLGPYRLVRNPMNIGEVALFLALAGWFGSGMLLLYAIASGLTFHLFVRLREEPAHRSKFGAAYKEYCASVARWWPRVP
ncbi:MAG: isoprenylcysteine carboxylmethyltransferase family protein [Elusimicrobia bacterium]|nr:isoprenylcysteine carboxylmethyltransferase family protein [Elusimicrobiota bacterium]